MRPDTQLLLQKNEIHVWIIGPHTAALPGDTHLSLTKDELKKAGRFKSAEDGRRWGFIRDSLRKILSRYTGEPAECLSFDCGEYGKPGPLQYPEREKVHFNLSHSGELGLLGVTQIAPIGIDIEQLRDFDNMAAVVSRFFSPAEQIAYASLEQQHRIAGFYNAWTRKESVIKAIGLGLSAPLDAFDVSLQPLSSWHIPQTRLPLPQHACYPLLQLTVHNDYIAALALCATDPSCISDLKVSVQPWASDRAPAI
jgi:4'-phosphopantetheinyl transferase